MRSFFNSVLGYFLTPGGLVLLGALDSSIVFFLPLGIDFAVVILSARNPHLFWLQAVLATAGSVLGAGGTIWLGRMVGEHGLSWLVKRSTLRRVESRISQSGAVVVAALGAIPPPFPFTAFVLASGATGANVWTFLVTLAGVRLARFMIEAALAARYGEQIVSWMDSDLFTIVVGALTALALVGTIVSGVAVYRSLKREKGRRGTERKGAGAGSRG